jgi:D-alanyl-D-alanine carboxypeptidase/D-alanyl-D-alanine-endopeptidase (penicillin-binding protein 4)
MPSPRLITALLIAVASSGSAQQPGHRTDTLLDSSPFDRAHWGILMVDGEGREVFARNPDRLFVPASVAKLLVAATASALLPQEFRSVTEVYASGPIRDGRLAGDLVVYGSGDPTFSERCYGLDTLAANACDSLWSRMDALADAIVAAGVRRVAGALIADGSAFEPTVVHPAWETYDVNWWYAAPVSALGFNDNAINVRWGPGPAVEAAPAVEFEPDLGVIRFENRARTGTEDEDRTIDFFRHPGSHDIWAEGVVPIGYRPRTEYFAMPDPNYWFGAALREALARRGVAIEGPTVATTDSVRTRAVRAGRPVVSFQSRPLADVIFPILNSSQNWFAEMLLKTVGRAVAGEGSWDAGLEVERRFLVDSVGIDSTAFSIQDGSGLSSGNVLSPRALVQLLRYVREHPNNAGFMRGLPRSGERGSLRTRFVDTPLEGRVVAKTGSIYRVSTLAGYIERPDGEVWTFAIMLNQFTARYSDVLSRMDAVLVEIAR